MGSASDLSAIYIKSISRGTRQVGVIGISITDAERIIKQCPLLTGIERIQFLARGFSAEHKFILWQHGEPAYVLRISDIEQSQAREVYFHLLRDPDRDTI